MTKEEKIKRFQQLAKTDQIEEIDASLVEIEETPVAAEPLYREPTPEELEQERLIREHKRARHLKLAGLTEGDEEPAHKAPAAGRMVLESKAPKKVMKLKMSSLSEGLRKEVAKLVKEGKTKISQFPEAIKTRVIKEMQVAELGMAAPTTAPHPGYPELDPLINTMGLSVRNTIIKLMDAHGLSDNDDPEMPFKAEYVMKGIINNLTHEA